jgi:peptide/nickel transport system substrate-binding protein
MADQLNKMASLVARGAMTRREFNSRAAALGASAAMASTVLATAARADTPVKGGTLIAGVSGGESTNSLDPALAASDVPYMINSTWGDFLVDVDSGTLKMRAAEEISSNADATEWKFKIRAGMEFHDGKTVTADDVVATLGRHTDDKAQSGAQGIVKGIKGMKAEGDMVTLTLESANADLPFLLADYHLIIQPGGGVDNPAAGIGSGAYKIVTNEPGVRTTFERHANYWDAANTGHADMVEVLSINDNTARTAALQSGQVHMMNRVDPKIAELLKGTATVAIERAAGPGHYVFIMRCDAAPFDNNDLRMALKLSANRQEMVDKILGGMGSRGNDFPINAAYPMFDASIAQREYDAAAAAEFYKKSGHDGSPIILQVAPGAFPGAVDAANLFAASANAAGVPLQIKLEPDDGYWSNVWNVAPFCASYWGGRPVQDQMYSTAYQSTADWNDTRFNNAEFDSLLLAARGELDLAKRKGMYGQMARILHDEGGLICPMFNDWIEGINDKVQGWVADGVQEVMNGLAPQKTWLA